MKKESSAVLGALLILLVAAPWAFGALSDPGLSKTEIRAEWDLFDRDPTRYEPPKDFPYRGLFEKASAKYGLPVTLLLAVAQGESDLDPMARSQADCLGLFQIQWPETANHLGIHEKSLLYRPEVSIDAGARYLAELKQRYGSTYHALAAYNYGPGRVSNGNVPDGAAWYAAYIMRQNQAFRVIEAKGAHVDFLVNRFTDYLPAVRFQRAWQNRTQIPLTVRKSDRYTYDLIIRSETPEQGHRLARKLMENTGFRALGLLEEERTTQ